MKSKRILGAVIAAAIAACVVASPAAAQNNNQGPNAGIYPAFLGPIGAAALAGTTTTTFSWFTTKSLLVGHKTVFAGFKYVTVGYKQVFTGFKYVKMGHKWVKVPTFKKIPVVKKVPTYNKVPQHKNVKVKHSQPRKSRMNQGKVVVGCVMGSAVGAITASIRKASAMGNPPRWRSQAEHERIVASGYERQFELTSEEASRALALCGLGSLTLYWQPLQP